jgi:hypothetical protein
VRAKDLHRAKALARFCRDAALKGRSSTPISGTPTSDPGLGTAGVLFPS